MRNIPEDLLAGDIKAAMVLVSTLNWLKVILACLVVFAYFTNTTWFTEIVVISVVLSLILPLGFFDVFIQKLLEYNTQKMEKRQVLNAAEANEHFEKLYRKVGK